MPTYFTCARCHKISRLSETEVSCPACGSSSGEFSSDRPLPSKPAAKRGREVPEQKHQERSG